MRRFGAETGLQEGMAQDNDFRENVRSGPGVTTSGRQYNFRKAGPEKPLTGRQGLKQRFRRTTPRESDFTKASARKDNGFSKARPGTAISEREDPGN